MVELASMVLQKQIVFAHQDSMELVVKKVRVYTLNYICLFSEILKFKDINYSKTLKFTKYIADIGKKMIYICGVTFIFVYTMF